MYFDLSRFSIVREFVDRTVHVSEYKKNRSMNSFVYIDYEIKI